MNTVAIGVRNSVLLTWYINHIKRMERREKAISRWQENRLQLYASDILNADNFLKSQNNIQHGTKSVMDHSMDVARLSIWIARKFRIKCEYRDLVRGALLHDYFLYDWHTKGEGHQLHGFFHPGIALRNAMEDFKLSARECDIIKKHMFPLTPIPPMCREAWIVTVADKYCSTLETLKIR